MNAQLVVGASGLVGSHVLKTLQDAGQRAIGTHLGLARPGTVRLDVRDEAAVRSLLRSERPPVVYLAAAMADVDRCETQPAESYAVNVLGTRNVLQACQEAGARLVFLSTDYVFNGGAGPYSETDAADPLNTYGRHKLIAEHMLALQARDALIVRTTVVYGHEAHGKNFVARLVRTLRAGQTLRAPIDQVGTPTYAPDLAQALVELVQRKASGVYHVVGAERANRYEFAVAAAREFALDPALIQPVPTEDLRPVARRPLDAGMTTDRLHAALGWRPRGYREGLAAMAQEEVVPA